LLNINKKKNNVKQMHWPQRTPWTAQQHTKNHMKDQWHITLITKSSTSFALTLSSDLLFAVFFPLEATAEKKKTFYIFNISICIYLNANVPPTLH